MADNEEIAVVFGPVTGNKLHKISGAKESGAIPNVPPQVALGIGHAKTGAGGIPASTINGSGDLEMASASCSYRVCDDAGKLTTNGENIVIFNPVTTAIGGNKFICWAYNQQGLPVAIVEPCP